MTEDWFWKAGRRRLAYWLSTTIELAGFEVTALSMLEALRGTLTKPASLETNYLARCIDNATRRDKAGGLNPKDKQRLDACMSFWKEFMDLADCTRSCITFDLMGTLEQKVCGYDLPDFLDPDDNQTWDYF